MHKKIVVSNLSDLPAAACHIVSAIGNHNVVALYGVMGAGKTTLIKALCDALGVSDQVNSPTFTLINEYKAANGRRIYHFDFYRINKIDEAFDLGYDEYFDSEGLCLIEWPDKIEPLLPDDCLRITIRVLADEVREIVFDRL